MCIKKVSLHYPAILRARQGHFALDKVKSKASTQAKEALNLIYTNRVDAYTILEAVPTLQPLSNMLYPLNLPKYPPIPTKKLRC